MLDLTSLSINNAVALCFFIMDGFDNPSFDRVNIPSIR